MKGFPFGQQTLIHQIHQRMQFGVEVFLFLILHSLLALIFKVLNVHKHFLLDLERRRLDLERLLLFDLNFLRRLRHIYRERIHLRSYPFTKTRHARGSF